ncbi:MAG: hypothetical protein LUC41_01835 [Clostridiales bacterium]|nr:hypothetical protein [Clostridiales bacterium]
MSEIRVKLVKAHEFQSKDIDVERELRDVQEYLDSDSIKWPEEGVGMMFLRGVYDNLTKKMATALVFSNHTGKTIDELHGIIEFKSQPPLQFARITINFDREFMGDVKNKEAILVHLNVPVKGMDRDRQFNTHDLQCGFSDVRVTYVSE